MKVYCAHCSKYYDPDLFELEDGYYYCHVCGQEIKKMTADKSEDKIFDNDIEEQNEKI